MIRLKDLREDRDLLQKDIAKILNTTQQQYSKYKLGTRQIPLDKIQILAIYYNTSVNYILGFTNEIKPYPRNKK